MSDDASTILDDALEAWSFARGGTIAEAENVPDERWDFRPHQESRTYAELVRHMLEAAQMLIGEAADPEGDFQRRSHAEHVRAHAAPLAPDAGPAELRGALRETSEALLARVRSAGAAHMATPIRRFDGGSWKRVSYVFYAASHEDYHRGQLALYARLMGLVPALTQRIHGAA